MDFWENWSQSARCEPARLTFIRSVEDLSAQVARAAERSQNIRVAASGHSHYPLIPTDGIVMDISALGGTVEVVDDGASPIVRVAAATSIASLGPKLHKLGLALSNQGDIDRQQIVGACATGTHGTGRELQNLSAGVVGASIMGADGNVVRCSPVENVELFRCAQLNLGALGIVLDLDIAVRPAYVLTEKGAMVDWQELRPTIHERVEASRHFEFFWYPQTDIAFTKTLSVTDEAPLYPLASEGKRQAFSYEVLANHRPDKHVEMEYSVPYESSLAALDEVRSLIQSEFADLVWPVEYRTVAADNVWLSPAFGRDVATISVHQGQGLAYEALFRRCEEIFLAYDGRPHWGKLHNLDGLQLETAHPAWRQWWTVRDQFDPSETFLNQRLSSWSPRREGSGQH